MNGRTISHSSISKLAQHHWRQIRYNFQFHWRPTPGLSRGNLWKVKPPFSFRFLQRTSAHITPQSYSFFGFSLFSIFQQETSKIWRNGNGIKVERTRRNPKRYERNDEENDKNRESTDNRAGAPVEHRSKCHQTSISTSHFTKFKHQNNQSFTITIFTHYWNGRHHFELLYQCMTSSLQQPKWNKTRIPHYNGTASRNECLVP